MPARKNFTALLGLLFVMILLLQGCFLPKEEAKGIGSAPTSSVNTVKHLPDENTVELSLFIDTPGWSFHDWSGAIPEEITKRTGVKLKVQVAKDSSELTMKIASGDLPDLVFTEASAERMSDPSLSYSWNELLLGELPDFRIDPEKVVLNLADDGKLYTVKGSFSTQSMWDKYRYAVDLGPGLMVRKDILDKLGNPPIRSLDDLLSVLESVKRNFPDITPLIMNPNSRWLNTYIASQFGAASSGLVERNGKLNSYIRQPEFLETYKFMNRLFRNGYIMAENFAFNDESVTNQLALDGKAFAYEWTSSGADVLNAQLKAKGEDFQFVQIIPPLSDHAVYYNDSAGFGSTFITKNSKHPEKAMAFLRFLMSDEGNKLACFGIEGTHWTWNNKGYAEFKYDRYNPVVRQALGANTWNRLVGDAVYDGLFYYEPGSQTTKANAVLKKMTIRNPWLSLVRPTNEAMKSTISNIDAMIRNEEVKIYLAKSEEEAVMAYRDMMDQADQMGLSIYEDWANAKYQVVLSKR